MEKTTLKEAPPTRTSQTHQQEVSHEMMVARGVATVDQETAKESEEDTQLFQRDLQKVMAIGVNAAANRRD